MNVPGGSNLLKVTFSGGNLSFPVVDSLNPQAVVGLEPDAEVEVAVEANEL